jgi:hypothetical protein
MGGLREGGEAQRQDERVTAIHFADEDTVRQ